LDIPISETRNELDKAPAMLRLSNADANPDVERYEL
jgi:hypothetical protein